MNYIYCRRSPDWSNFDLNSFSQMNDTARDLMKNWEPRLIQAISAWNRFLPINFFEFRTKLKQLSRHNIAQVRDVCFLNRENIQEALSDKEAYLFFIDDDDFVSPYIFKELDLQEEIDCIIWPTVHFRENLVIHDISKPVDAISYAYSNNFVLYPSGFQRLVAGDPSLEFLEDHRRLDKLMVMLELNVKKMYDKYLSVYNQSPASATKLWNSYPSGKIDILKMIREYNYLEVPSSIDWFVPYYKMVWKLIEGLTEIKL